MNKITLKQLVVPMKSKVIALVILNALLLFIAVYGLWGAFWVWQPGAEPPQWAPLYGSQSYLQHVIQKLKDYPNHYNVTNAVLVYGFLSYRIDVWINGVQKVGATRFDWTQFSLILLAFFDGWTLIDFLRSRKAAKSP
jgi:hypothetical protein